MSDSDNTTDFDIEQGGTVLVRIREHGTSGKLQAKFVASVIGFEAPVGPRDDRVVLDPPWGYPGAVSLGPQDAEFEIVDRETLQ